MPDPVPAWAAVSPGGRLCLGSDQPSEMLAWAYLCRELEMRRKTIEENGWRVVPVKIEVMEK